MIQKRNQFNDVAFATGTDRPSPRLAPRCLRSRLPSRLPSPTGNGLGNSKPILRSVKRSDHLIGCSIQVSCARNRIEMRWKSFQLADSPVVRRSPPESLQKKKNRIRRLPFHNGRRWEGVDTVECAYIIHGYIIQPLLLAIFGRFFFIIKPSGYIIQPSGNEKVAIPDELELLKHGTSQRHRSRTRHHRIWSFCTIWFDHPVASFSHFGPVR